MHPWVLCGLVHSAPTAMPLKPSTNLIAIHILRIDANSYHMNERNSTLQPFWELEYLASMAQTNLSKMNCECWDLLLWKASISVAPSDISNREERTWKSTTQWGERDIHQGQSWVHWIVKGTIKPFHPPLPSPFQSVVLRKRLSAVLQWLQWPKWPQIGTLISHILSCVGLTCCLNYFIT